MNSPAKRFSASPVETQDLPSVNAELAVAKQRQAHLEQALAQTRAALAASERRYEELAAHSHATQAALAADHDLLNAIMNTSVAAITVLDTCGTIIFANDRAEQVLGLSKHDLTERTYDAPEWRATTIEGDPWPDEQQPFRRVMESRQPIFDVRHAIEWPSGERKILSINGAPLKDATGAITRIVFLVSDITSSVLAEQALRLNEERYRVVSETTSDYAYSFRMDAAGAMTPEWVTDSYVRITGYQRGAISRPEDWLAMIHPDDRAIAVANNSRLARGEPTTNELRIVRPDGQVRWLRHYNRPEWSPELGRVVRVYGAAQDITERKYLEQQLAHAQKMEAIGLLAGGIAHDFNNFLTAIIGNCDLVLGGLDERSAVYADVAHTRQIASRAAALTRQLLAFGRRQSLQPQTLDLNAVVTANEQLYQRLLGDHISLVPLLAPGLEPVYADPVQVEQVMLNLVMNARDAMPEGGVLTIETSLAESASGFVALTVSDTGCGMNAATQARIFEPFFTTKGQGKGTGLGLATVHGIVTQSGGQIEVCSEVGLGTTFVVLLPCAGRLAAEIYATS